MDLTSRRAERAQLIRRLETLRSSRVITYVCGDRRWSMSQINDDAVRPLYEHLRRIAPTAQVPKLDLLVYSRGGDVDVPWRIVTMFREHAERFGVLVPFRANSAATLLALGADEIVLGPKSELGPIDPSITFSEDVTGPDEIRRVVRKEVNVEDAMAYASFLEARVGLRNPRELAESVKLLSDEVGPVELGALYRTHQHIRDVAGKLLDSRREPTEKGRKKQIIDTLAERTYAHGHAIGRTEALDLKLPVVARNPEVENAMWELFCMYEGDLRLLDPVDPDTELGPDSDEVISPVVLSVIESRDLLHEFRGELTVRRIRSTPPQQALNVRIAISIPEAPDPSDPVRVKQLMTEISEEAGRKAGAAMREELRRAAAPLGTQVQVRGPAWRLATDRSEAPAG